MLYLKVLRHASCGFSTLATFKEHDRIIRRKRCVFFPSCDSLKSNYPRSTAIRKERKHLGLSWNKKTSTFLVVNNSISSNTDIDKKKTPIIYLSASERATEGLEVWREKKAREDMIPVNDISKFWWPSPNFWIFSSLLNPLLSVGSFHMSAPGSLMLQLLYR